VFRQKRSRLAVGKEPANLMMIIHLIGFPFSSWNVTPLVKTWLGINHFADDNRFSRKRKIMTLTTVKSLFGNI